MIDRMDSDLMRDPTMRAAKSVYLKSLAETIRQNYGCVTLHTASFLVPVELGKKRFKLQVETFQLVNCDAGETCFAWFHPPDEWQRNVVVATVIASQQVGSPEAAVRAYLTHECEEEEAA